MTFAKFADNKYTKWYFNIVNDARSKEHVGYVEHHHIFPRSLGGDNNTENIVTMSARQHFVCHLLLVRMTSSNDRIKMLHAAHHMSICHRKSAYHVSSMTYEMLKKSISKLMKNNKRGLGQAGWRHTDEAKQKMSLAKKGKVPAGLAEAQSKRWSGAGNPRANTTNDVATSIRNEYLSSKKQRGVVSLLARKHSLTFKTVYSILHGSYGGENIYVKQR